MTGRFFWVALGLIGISWLLNSVYANAKQLKEPIFLDHYIDVELQDDLYMTFYYLTNKNDSSVVSSIAAGEIFGYPENHYFPEEQPYNQQTFNNHVLRSVTIQLYNHHQEQTSEPKKYSFTEMDVFFSNGKQITAPIGIVNIRQGEYDSPPLEQVSSRSSNDYDQAFYRALEPFTIEKIEGSFQDVLQDHFFIKINTPATPLRSEPTDEGFQDLLDQEWESLPGVNLQSVQFPLDLKEHETLVVNSTFSADFKAVLDVRIYLSGTTESGDAFSTANGLITSPYLEQQDVNVIIKDKTKEDINE